MGQIIINKDEDKLRKHVPSKDDLLIVEKGLYFPGQEEIGKQGGFILFESNRDEGLVIHVDPTYEEWILDEETEIQLYELLGERIKARADRDAELITS